MRHLLICLLLVGACASTYAQDYKKAKPSKGEGIYAFLERNGIDRKFKREFIELNRSRLGANQSLLIGVDYHLDPAWVVVPKEEWRVYPIFGKKHQRLKILNNELEGSVFYLVSGHGGPDPGAVGKHSLGSLCEDEYAYDVTLRLARWLIQRNALVYFIVRDDNDGIRDGNYLPCDKDEYAYTRGSIPINQLRRLEQRTDVINSLYRKHKGSKYQRMISIHVDSRATNENVDVFFYYHANSRRGKKCANDILQTFDANYKEFQPNRTYRGSVRPRSSLFVLKQTSPAAVFVELGNIVNKKDQRRILLEDNRQALAKWIGEGLVKNFKER